MTTARQLLLAGAAALGLAGAGCATKDDAFTREYHRNANVRFAEDDVRERLRLVFVAKHPAEVAEERMAFRAQKRILGPVFLGEANFGYPKRHPVPLEKVWVMLLIDREGNVASAECAPDGDQPVKAGHEAVITNAIRQWRFTPQKADGENIPCGKVFPVLCDGTRFFISSPSTLH